MLEWLTRRRTRPGGRTERNAATDARPTVRGQSAALHKYLNDRYADAVVMTFAEIEDLLGCPLPTAARSSETWWTGPDPAGVLFADAWRAANRTARPNLQALTVLFDRVGP